MNSFSDRLKVWLAGNEQSRRSGMFGISVIALLSGLVGFKGFLIVAGLCLMAEGMAMLLTADLPGRPQA